MRSSSQTTRLLQNVFIRRGGQSLGEFPTRLLIPKIREGALKPSDEISGDGRNWMALGRHHQLSRYFPNKPATSPPGMEQELGDLAALLKEINQE